jgi:hypothetical protein
MKKSISVLDSDKDGFVSWSELFPKARVDTEKAYGRWASEARGRGEKLDQRTQVPRAFSLGDNQALTIVNLTKKAIRYQHRWEGENDWESTTLPAEGSHTHSPLKAGKDAPRLEVKFDTGETGMLRVGKSYKYSDGKKSRSVEQE